MGLEDQHVNQGAPLFVPQELAFPTEMSSTQYAAAVNVSPALSAKHTVSICSQVRRLTEVECERLQGFPDNYTNIRYGRPKYPDQICPSGHRYKALGNSMAVPVIRWIGKRIDRVMARDEIN